MSFGEIAAPSTHPIAPNAPICLCSNPIETDQLQNGALRAAMRHDSRFGGRSFVFFAFGDANTVPVEVK